MVEVFFGTIEVLYDHLSCWSFNYFKILTVYQNIGLTLQKPTRKQSRPPFWSIWRGGEGFVGRGLEEKI
jgi:hypothetical protein